MQACRTIAEAINDHCASCETLAYAYQLVLVLPDLRQPTDAGRARIATILAAIVVLGASDIPIDELRARLDDSMLTLRHVVATELEHVPSADDAPAAESTTTSTPEPPATATPGDSAPPAEDPTATAAPDDAATTTPDPTRRPGADTLTRSGPGVALPARQPSRPRSRRPGPSGQ